MTGKAFETLQREISLVEGFHDCVLVRAVAEVCEEDITPASSATLQYDVSLTLVAPFCRYEWRRAEIRLIGVEAVKLNGLETEVSHIDQLNLSIKDGLYFLSSLDEKAVAISSRGLPEIELHSGLPHRTSTPKRAGALRNGELEDQGSSRKWQRIR